jgi:alpha-beta hydrolase superfamily lysophospholipase
MSSRQGTLVGSLVVVLIAVLAPAAHAFDAAREARNYSKIGERFQHVYGLDAAYQADLRTLGAQKEIEGYRILATDGPARPYGRDFTGNLCSHHNDGCAGDIRYYGWGDSAGATVKPILFTARNGSTLSGHVWSSDACTRKCPGIVITNGSIQAPEELYWFMAADLARAGYVVMTWDPQGQGFSDTYGDGVDRNDGVPSQTGEPFYDGTEDALDFFFSTATRPYVPRPSCSTGTSHADKQRARVADGRNAAYNPLVGRLDTARVGLAGHSLGAGAVSYVGQIDPRVKAIVAWDNLRGPGPAPYGCPSGSSKRPDAPAAKPALGMSGDYFLTPTPYTSDPDRGAKSTGAQALAAAGVPTGELVIRGGTHYEFSFIPNPGFGATLRGEDLVAWYTTAWFDRFVKGDRKATARLFTDRWRADGAEAAVDPGGDGNLFSFYYDSPLSLDGRSCADLREATGCGLEADGLGPYSALEAAGG